MSKTEFEKWFRKLPKDEDGFTMIGDTTLVAEGRDDISDYERAFEAGQEQVKRTLAYRATAWINVKGKPIPRKKWELYLFNKGKEEGRRQAVKEIEKEAKKAQLRLVKNGFDVAVPKSWGMAREKEIRLAALNEAEKVLETYDFVLNLFAVIGAKDLIDGDEVYDGDEIERGLDIVKKELKLKLSQMREKKKVD